MEQVITLKLRLYPDEEQAKLLAETARAYRAACNLISPYAFERNCYVQKTLQDALYSQIREEFGLGAQMTCSTFRTVLAAYKTMRTNNERKAEQERKAKLANGEALTPEDWEVKLTLAKFKCPFVDLVRKRDYTFKKHPRDTKRCSDCKHSDKCKNCAEHVVSIGTLDGRIEMRYSAEGMEDAIREFEHCGAKIVYKHGRFYMHLSVKVTCPDVNVLGVTNVAGVDRGERFLWTAYDSKGKTTFYSGKEVRAKKQHLRRKRRELQKKHTPSSRRRLKAMGSRENRWMQDVNHCASKALVSAYDSPTLFAVEDLQGLSEVIRKRDGRTKKQRQVKDSLVAWSQYDLLQKFKYKAIIAGHIVVERCPAMTSQMCPKCGHICKESRNKKTHTYTCCNCGYRSNDDRIGGMNLYRMGIEYLVQCQSNMLDLDGAG